MALVNCKECGKEISDTSKVCVHCGAKQTTHNKNKIAIIVAIIAILIVAGILIFALNKGNNETDILNVKIDKAVSLLEKYKNDELDTLELTNKLDTLHDEVYSLAEKEQDSNKRIKLSSLAQKLSSMSLNIKRYYADWGEHKTTSDTKINEYIKDIKSIK